MDSGGGASIAGPGRIPDDGGMTSVGRVGAVLFLASVVTVGYLLFRPPPGFVPFSLGETMGLAVFGVGLSFVSLTVDRMLVRDAEDDGEDRSGTGTGTGTGTDPGTAPGSVPGPEPKTITVPTAALDAAGFLAGGAFAALGMVIALSA